MNRKLPEEIYSEINQCSDEIIELFSGGKFTTAAIMSSLINVLIMVSLAKELPEEVFDSLVERTKKLYRVGKKQ